MQFIYLNLSILTIRRLVIPVSPVSNTLQAPPTIYALNFATFRSMADLTLLYAVLILEGNKNHLMLVPVRLPRSVWQLCQLLSSAEHLLSPVSLIHSSFAHVRPSWTTGPMLKISTLHKALLDTKSSRTHILASCAL